MQETLARCSLARGQLSAAGEELLVACELLRHTPQPLYIARLAEVSARRLLLGGDPRSAALALAAARRYRSDRALVSFGIFAREVAADEVALAQHLQPADLADVARSASTLALQRPCRAAQRGIGRRGLRRRPVIVREPFLSTRLSGASSSG
jgi:ATP/maltotriose-dependent transcriptional regulator MalT